jgi:hypothetical protein
VTGRRLASPSGAPVRPWLAGVAVALVAAGCGNREAHPRAAEAPVLEDQAAAMGQVGRAAVLVRGRIGADRLTLEPVIATDADPQVPGVPGGAHRLTGRDDAGETLFDFRFDGVPVADLPAGPEAHFQFVIPVGPGGSLRLARVELQSDDGRRADRRARLSTAEMLEAAGADGALTIDPLGPDRLRIRWDADVFPTIVVQDPETRRVLALGQGGETVVSPDGTTLDITLSEGVRSAVRRIVR